MATEILTQFRNEPTPREAFRRGMKAVLDPAVETERPAYSPSLLLDAKAKSGATDLATLAAGVGGMTDAERRDLIAKLRVEIAADTELLNSLESQ
jgi:hypothetical protein